MKSGEPKKAEDEVPPQAPGICKFAVVLFTLSYLTFALWLVVDLWVRDKAFLTSVLSIKKEGLDVTFVMALYSVTGALLGSAVLDLVSFHKYSAVERNFQLSHVPGYLYGPWLAATVGLVIFCLLQSGLLVFSGGSQNLKIEETTISKMGYLSVGFLAGFGWMNAVEKIREIVSRFFAKDPRAKKKLVEGAQIPNETGQPETPAAGLAATGVEMKRVVTKKASKKKKSGKTPRGSK